MAPLRRLSPRRLRASSPAKAVTCRNMQLRWLPRLPCARPRPRGLPRGPVRASRVEAQARSRCEARPAYASLLLLSPGRRTLGIHSCRDTFRSPVERCRAARARVRTSVRPGPRPPGVRRTGTPWDRSHRFARHESPSRVRRVGPQRRADRHRPGLPQISRVTHHGQRRHDFQRAAQAAQAVDHHGSRVGQASQYGLGQGQPKARRVHLHFGQCTSP